MNLKGKIVERKAVGDSELNAMFALMEKHYDNMTYENFTKDIEEKDYCIILYDEESSEIKGFSTQKIISLNIEGEEFHGVFSGDTVIDKEYWGSMELYKIFAQFFIEYGEKYEKFYWFLISKGYKTYKMLPLFFKFFYPNYREESSYKAKALMDAFGEERYHDEYDRESGVIKYTGIKDRVKDGVADITEKHLKDRDIAYFVNKNRGYINGDDLICITELRKENLKDRVKKLLGIIK